MKSRVASRETGWSILEEYGAIGERDHARLLDDPYRMTEPGWATVEWLVLLLAGQPFRASRCQTSKLLRV